MYFSPSAAAVALAIAIAPELVSADDTECTLEPIPTNEDDFGEPAWEAILELAFPPWKLPKKGCPRLDALGGELMKDFSEYPEYEEGKWNPCYYTKAFAGLDPELGGYPTPIDTKYAYEFAAPFLKQPGDGSVHHCAFDADDVGACAKAGVCDGVKDCAIISDEAPFNGGPGHVPPFVPLAAVKNAYNSCSEDICASWFDFDEAGCNIKKTKLDELVIEQFGSDDGTTVNFQPPILIDGEPSSTYYRLEYLGQSPACDDGNCRGPHYCTKEVADAGNIWGDFCPYVQTGDDSGQYRHPHLALAALELWIANQCMPDKCASEWLESPAGQGYAADAAKTTSIVWSEMDDNSDPMAQPAVPYVWPNSGSGMYPGYDALYGDAESKDIEGTYEAPGIEYVDSGAEPIAPSPAEPAPPTGPTEPVDPAPTPASPTPSPTAQSSAFTVSGSVVAAFAALVASVMM